MQFLFNKVIMQERKDVIASKGPLLGVGGGELHVVYPSPDQGQPPCERNHVPGQLQPDVVPSVKEEEECYC